jgi:hypothetical protein
MKKAVIFFVLIFSFSSSLLAQISQNEAPKCLKENFNPSFLIGSSQLRFLGFEVYQISLWSEKSKFSYDQKFAIQIRYHLAFSKDDLVEKSIDEISRLNKLDAEEESFYRLELNKSLRSVAKNDEKVAIFDPQKGVKILLNDKLIGEISDKKLARLFVDIWLDERGSYPKVTKKLLGK